MSTLQARSASLATHTDLIVSRLRLDNGYSDDQEFLRDTTRKFLESEVPLTTVRALAEDPAGFDRGWWKRGAELGWTSMLVPEELGGGSLGGGLIDLIIIAKEFGRLVTP